MDIVNETGRLMKENYDMWSNSWNDYADRINANIELIQNKRGTFNEWHPLKIYMSVKEAKEVRGKFSVRFKGQEVAFLKVNNDLKPMLTIDKELSISNSKYFSINIEPGEYHWISEHAKKFRADFKACKVKQGSIEEHMLESLILDEMEKKDEKEKFVGTMRDIQPVELIDKIRFQMPIPISGHTGKPEYKGSRGKGNIDILARVGSGGGTKIGVIELKRDNIASYKYAASQSIIYTTCLRYLLRDDKMGLKWWKIFGFLRKIPKKLKLYSIVMIPESLSDKYYKELKILNINNNEIGIENDVIQCRYIFFNLENDKIKISKCDI